MIKFYVGLFNMVHKKKTAVITGVAVLVGIVIIALAVGYIIIPKETSPRSPKSLVFRLLKLTALM